MTTYHLSLALAHWTSRPELQGKREYLYRNVAWLLALAHCLNAGPFGDKHRGHVAHERIVDFMPAIDPKRSSEIAAFWHLREGFNRHSLRFGPAATPPAPAWQPCARPSAWKCRK